MKTAIQVIGAALLLTAMAACQGPYLMEILQEQTAHMKAQTAKAITAFSFASPAATGTIDQNAKTIVVTVPFATNVTALAATFTTTGSSVTVGSAVQMSGTTANNFTIPVTYTVMAADGSTTSYTVTVTVAPSNAKAITTFSFPSVAATGTIDENAKIITVTVPYGTSRMALVAAFTTTGSSVKVGSKVQVSGTTANNFTFPVTYTVTAADGSTANYAVTATIALSGAKAMTAFSFASIAATGTINDAAKTISVTVPCGTNVTALVATFTTTGSSVKVGSMVQVNGTTPNNFSSPLIYVVTAADGSTASYTITVTIALSGAKAMTAFSFASIAATGTINEAAKTISVTVPYNTNVTALVASFTTTGASVMVGSTVQESGTTSNDFSSPIVYTVTAADGSTASYTVTAANGLFSDGFENMSGWSTARLTGNTAAWDQALSGSYPSASPHAGSYLMRFNSFSAGSGQSARVFRTFGFPVPGTCSTATLTFWMYHDSGYSSCADTVQAVVSTDGSSWANIGSPVSRYDGSTGWKQVSVSLNSYIGRSNLYIGFIGVSRYGNDEYIDDVAVTAQ